MHDCPYCGMACDCDGEDHYQPAPHNCLCDCEYEDEEIEGEHDYYDDGDDY